MLIESLEKKTKLAMFTVLLAVSASTVICAETNSSRCMCWTGAFPSWQSAVRTR